MKGFDRVAAAVKNQQTGAYAKDFILRPDESAVVWFNGDPENEPLEVQGHNCSVMKGNEERFEFLPCGGDECVMCHVRAGGDNRIGDVKPMFSFNVFDTRYFHKAPKKDDPKRFDYIPCKNGDEIVPQVCRRCDARKERTQNGQRRWRVPPKWAGVIGAVDADLKKRCTCGGKILINDKTGVPIRCAKCGPKMNPLDIQRVPITITRTGAGTSTVYSAVPILDDELAPPDVTNADIYDLEAVEAYKNPAYYARVLRVRNPFGPAPAQRASRQQQHVVDDDDDAPATTYADEDDDGYEDEVDNSDPF